MAAATTIATPDEIQQVVRQMVAYCHPQKVVLFGSYADGTPKPASDVDLLVVMDSVQRFFGTEGEFRHNRDRQGHNPV